MWLFAPALACLAAVLLYVFHAYFIHLIVPDLEPDILLKISAIVNFYAFAWLIARVVSAVLMRKDSGKRKRPKLLRELISATAFTVATVAAVGLLLGQSAGGVLASSGLVIAILGFAIRNVLADVLSGIAIGLEAPFRIGDWVEFDETTSGRVIEIGWRTTRVRTVHDTYMILPNSQISRLMLTNYSAPRKNYQASLEILLGHEISIAQAKKLLLGAAVAASSDASGKVVGKPVVHAAAYDADGVRYSIKYWVPSYASDGECRDAVLAAVDKAVREQEVMASSSSENLAPAAAQAAALRVGSA